jgi:hypothetical protein
MSDNPNTFIPRTFVIGANRIVEDESTTALSAEQMRTLLRSNYPEVANATIRERTDDNGNRVVEFLPQPGRKG